MKRRLIAISLTTVLLFAVIASAAPAMAKPGVLEVGPGKTYETIQAAIDAALDGDTILVNPGTYTENVYVWKPLNIMSKKMHAAIVDGRGGGWGRNTFTVIARNVTIDGFTIYGPDHDHNNDAGIMIGGLFPGDPYHLQVEHITVRNCIIYANNYPEGPEFAIGSWCAIYIWKSSHNLIVNNDILGAYMDGIEIYDGYADHQVVYVPGTTPAPGSDAGCKFPHPCSRHWRDEHGALQTWDGVQLYPGDYELVSPSRYNKVINNTVLAVAQGTGGKGIFVGAYAPAIYWTDNTGTKVHGNYFEGDSPLFWTGMATGYSTGSKIFSGNAVEGTPAYTGEYEYKRIYYVFWHGAETATDYKFVGNRWVKK